MTVGYLVSKPHDFKVCRRCGSFNWYENRYCASCGTRFRRAVEGDVEEYLKVRGQDEHFCDECEIDV